MYDFVDEIFIYSVCNIGHDVGDLCLTLEICCNPEEFASTPKNTPRPSDVPRPRSICPDPGEIAPTPENLPRSRRILPGPGELAPIPEMLPRPRRIYPDPGQDTATQPLNTSFEFQHQRQRILHPAF